MSTVHEIKTALGALAEPEKAAYLPRFFKCGPGQYAEGDQFIGVTVPHQRKVVKQFSDKITLPELGLLLSSEIHEHRLTALLILVEKFEKTIDLQNQEEIIQFYLTHKKFINNWDLVDNSCYKILGRYCYENHEDDILRKLAHEDHLWSKRIAVVSTMYHIKKNSFPLVKELVTNNLQHPHDLMHKANGWLLREMGKKNQHELIDFLKEHYQHMPRTTLRYAIERFDDELRQKFLKGNF
ncbi:DNA alkylation repair protein [Chryseobacterium sp. 6424]|uniref:DNA alkylation repair protein n=1 Tax=Chryseobacterium sp. 6424 TaxID=2039166 RepID=UPI000EFCD659|nr:DNA alkylation repair protein [Chryseobacterium sp. 6424]AYO56735.1 DNA alkylation repair protein [Chryseobacterium sp. 6424]